MEAPAIDLTDLLGFDVDDPKAPEAVAASPPADPVPEQPMMTFELEDDEDDEDEPASTGALMTRALSDEILAPPAAPIDVDGEALCLFYDTDDPDTCSMVIEDDEDDGLDDEPEPVVSGPSVRVVAFNGGRSRDLVAPGAHADLVEQPSLHDLQAHLFHLKGDPLDAVHMLLRSQIPAPDRVAQPECAAAVIKAHHDLRFWEPLLSNRRFQGHVSDLEADLSLLKSHLPDPSRSALWEQWKQAHDRILGLLPEERRLAV